MGEPMIGYSGSDWSRRRITAVMGDAADRCAALAHIVGTGRLGDDIGDLRRQAQSVQVLRWAEGIFRSWAEDTTVERGIGLDDLEQARDILDTAERAMV